MFEVLDSAIADDHVGIPGEDRRDQLRDVGRVVLAVRVGVDDHVGAELQRCVETGLKGGREALVVGQADQVVDPALTGDGEGAVGRPVVDHQPVDPVEAFDLAGQPAKRPRQILLLVETGDLDDQFHPRRIIATHRTLP